jgi:lipoprotein NlpI
VNYITIACSLAAALLLVAPAAAQTQPANDAERCVKISGNPDLAIQQCTRAIESGRYSGEILAKLHHSRGTEWAAKGVHDRAIADYDAALRLNPRYGDAFHSRGNAWSSKGDPDRAIADFDAAIALNPTDAFAHSSRAFERTAKGEYARAITDYDAALRLNPKSPSAYFARGRAQLYAGNYPRAIADLEEAFKSEPNQYTSLWLYLARKRSDAFNAEELLDSETRATRGGGWPTVIIVLYLGRTDRDSVFAASTNADASKQHEQRCEANFYVAHWHLLKGERERAAPLLKEAQGGCPREFLEYEGTVAELRRLQKP